MIDVIKPLIKQFLPFAQERMGFDKPPRLFVRRDEQNAQNPLGKTAYYDPSARSVTLYITGRHPKDVMRSLSHELVHHTQNCNGEFDNVGEMGDGYAQNDAHLREMERQAYEIGNLCFRDWEDSIKHTIYFEHLQKGVENIMSTKDWKNKEMSTLLTEKWGFSFNLDRLNEGGSHTGGTGDRPTEERSEEDIAGEPGADSKREKLSEDSGEDEAWHDWLNEHADDDHIKEMKHHLRALESDRDHERDEAEYDHDDYEDDRLKEGKKKLAEDSGEEEAYHDWMNEHADDDHILELERHLRALKEDRNEDAKHADYGDDEYLTPDEEADDVEFAAEEDAEELEEGGCPHSDAGVDGAVVMGGDDLEAAPGGDVAALASDLLDVAQQLAAAVGASGGMEDEEEVEMVAALDEAKVRDIIRQSFKRLKIVNKKGK